MPLQQSSGLAALRGGVPALCRAAGEMSERHATEPLERQGGTAFHRFDVFPRDRQTARMIGPGDCTYDDVPEDAMALDYWRKVGLPEKGPLGSELDGARWFRANPGARPVDVGAFLKRYGTSAVAQVGLPPSWR